MSSSRIKVLLFNYKKHSFLSKFKMIKVTKITSGEIFVKWPDYYKVTA